MSATPIAFISTPNLSTRNRISTYKISSLKHLSLNNHLFFRIPYGSFKRTSNFTPFKPFSPPVMEWQDCTVKTEIDVPVSVAYNCYSDREAIPRWMPFISSVKILEDKPDVSRWSLKYKAFGRDIEFSWLARNMQPIPNQKIHWRSLEGLPNRGAVRFFPKGPSSCSIELTVSYEVPQLLNPVASALQPFLESLLRRGLKRLAVKDMNPSIYKICKDTLDFNFCEDVLFKNPCSQAADLLGMGSIAVNITSANMIDTNNYIQTLNQGSNDPDLKKLLRYCSVEYEAGIDALGKAADYLNAHDYENLN